VAEFVTREAFANKPTGMGSAYIEALPSDRVTHMLGRPIERLVTDSGDLGDLGGFSLRKIFGKDRKRRPAPAPAQPATSAPPATTTPVQSATPAASPTQAASTWQQFAYPGPSYVATDPFNAPGYNPYVARASLPSPQPLPPRIPVQPQMAPQGQQQFAAPRPVQVPVEESYADSDFDYEEEGGSMFGMDDAGSSMFIEVQDLQGLGCGGSIEQAAADAGLGCCGQIGRIADDGAMGEGALRRFGRSLMAKVRNLARAERRLVSTDQKVAAGAAAELNAKRNARRNCRAKIQAARLELKAASRVSGEESGLSGSARCAKGAWVRKTIADLNALAALDRALEASERQLLTRAAQRLADVRTNLSKVRGGLRSCKKAGANVEAERLRAKLEACNRRYGDHMRKDHGKIVDPIT